MHLIDPCHEARHLERSRNCIPFDAAQNVSKNQYTFLGVLHSRFTRGPPPPKLGLQGVSAR